MIIGLQGYAGSGKSTIATYLATKHGFARRHIKTPIADLTETLLLYTGMSMGDMARHIDGDLKRTPIPELGGRTATEIQQFMGTEFGREFIHPDLWLDIWSAWAAGHERVVQESVRFANEADRCDVIWEIRRPGYEALNGHVSEGLPRERPDVVIHNYGSLEQLRAAVDGLMEKGA